MKKYFFYLMIFALIILFNACNKNKNNTGGDMKRDSSKLALEALVKAYAPTEIKVDLINLTDNQIKMISCLVEAGKYADEIFWKQSSSDGISIRDSLKNLTGDYDKLLLDYVLINYGPYDLIYEGKRFVGTGPKIKPTGANLYPIDLTKEELEKYILANPSQKEELENDYTIVIREGDRLKAIPYHIAYPEVEKLAKKLEEAAEYSDDALFKKYLLLRANAIRTDNYFESDIAWMDMKNSKFDIIIGPIETYEDKILGKKTAYEAVVVIKDEKATKELEFFKQHIFDFEQKLPYDKKYIRKNVGGGEHLINIVNVVYFGGDCQAGIKTIACNLPNDPKVRSLKGGKNTMYKNMIQAKFEKIVVPIAKIILDESIASLADKEAFMSFVLLHEISHSLGRDYVFGKDNLSVRDALKNNYSAIEECKADILSMYNHKILMDMGFFSPEYIKKAMVTYLAGLYRSVRFGAEEAHGKANLIQLNFLKEQGAIKTNSKGQIIIDESIFFDKVAKLANKVLTIEAEGDYEEATMFINKYGVMNEEISKTIDLMKDVPRDLNTKYTF